MINRLENYSADTNLALNEDKTKWMLFSTRKMSQVHGLHASNVEISCNGRTLERRTKQKLLGVEFEEHLVWNEHITSLIASCYSALSIVKKLRNLAPFHVRKLLMETLILSKLDYSCTVFHPLPSCQLKRLQRVQNVCAGFHGITLNPLHWFQFADDAAVISAGEKENQILLNRFTVWCRWSDMIIRVDKCSTFGIKKQLTRSIQYLPKLFVNNCLIPRVEIGESFRYLGRYFNFKMSDDDHKSEVLDSLTDLLNEIDDLPLHPKNKIRLYSQYALSKISWHFTVSDIGKTWVNEMLDTVVSKYIRKWLELPISATLSNILLPYN